MQRSTSRPYRTTPPVFKWSSRIELYKGYLDFTQTPPSQAANLPAIAPEPSEEDFLRSAYAALQAQVRRELRFAAVSSQSVSSSNHNEPGSVSGLLQSDKLREVGFGIPDYLYCEGKNLAAVALEERANYQRINQYCAHAMDLAENFAQYFKPDHHVGPAHQAGGTKLNLPRNVISKIFPLIRRGERLSADPTINANTREQFSNYVMVLQMTVTNLLFLEHNNLLATKISEQIKQEMGNHVATQIRKMFGLRPNESKESMEGQDTKVRLAKESIGKFADSQDLRDGMEAILFGGEEKSQLEEIIPSVVEFDAQLSDKLADPTLTPELRATGIEMSRRLQQILAEAMLWDIPERRFTSPFAVFKNGLDLEKLTDALSRRAGQHFEQDLNQLTRVLWIKLENDKSKLGAKIFKHERVSSEIYAALNSCLNSTKTAEDLAKLIALYRERLSVKFEEPPKKLRKILSQQVKQLMALIENNTDNLAYLWRDNAAAKESLRQEIIALRHQEILQQARDQYAGFKYKILVKLGKINPEPRREILAKIRSLSEGNSLDPANYLQKLKAIVQYAEYDLIAKAEFRQLQILNTAVIADLELRVLGQGIFDPKINFSIQELQAIKSAIMQLSCGQTNNFSTIQALQSWIEFKENSLEYDPSSAQSGKNTLFEVKNQARDERKLKLFQDVLAHNVLRNNIADLVRSTGEFKLQPTGLASGVAAVVGAGLNMVSSGIGAVAAGIILEQDEAQQIDQASRRAEKIHDFSAWMGIFTEKIIPKLADIFEQQIGQMDEKDVRRFAEFCRKRMFAALTYDKNISPEHLIEAVFLRKEGIGFWRYPKRMRKDFFQLRKNNQIIGLCFDEIIQNAIAEIKEQDGEIKYFAWSGNFKKAAKAGAEREYLAAEANFRLEHYGFLNLRGMPAASVEKICRSRADEDLCRSQRDQYKLTRDQQQQPKTLLGIRKVRLNDTEIPLYAWLGQRRSAVQEVDALAEDPSALSADFNRLVSTGPSPRPSQIFKY